MKKKELHSWHVWLAARDAQCAKGADQSVLLALAGRTDPQKGFTSFPSYAQLALDAGFSSKQCRRSAKALEDAGFIRRRTRFNTSSVFTVNYARLRSMADANNAEKKRRNEEQVPETGEADFPEPPESPWTLNELDDTSGLELSHDVANDPEHTASESIEDDRTPPTCYTVQHLMRLTQNCWPDHPIYADDEGMFFLEKDLFECVALAGSIMRLSEVLTAIYWEHGRAYASIQKANKLSAYLKSRFPAYLDQYEAQYPPEFYEYDEEPNDPTN